MGQRELLRLHEHAARAAARVIDAALVRLDHLDQHPNHRLRGEELAAALALGAREAGQEILIDPPQQVLGLVRLLAQRNARDQVDQFAEHHLVERRSGILLGQHTLERSVRRLDRQHRVVDQFADGRLLGVGLEVRPAGILRNPEDVLGRVFVLVLGVGILIRQQSLISSLEGVRDVFQEDQAEDDVLVFRRLQVLPEFVSRQEHVGLETQVGAVSVFAVSSLWAFCHVSVLSRATACRRLWFCLLFRLYGDGLIVLDILTVSGSIDISEGPQVRLPRRWSGSSGRCSGGWCIGGGKFGSDQIDRTTASAPLAQDAAINQRIAGRPVILLR